MVALLFDLSVQYSTVHQYIIFPYNRLHFRSILVSAKLAQRVPYCWVREGLTKTPKNVRIKYKKYFDMPPVLWKTVRTMNCLFNLSDQCLLHKVHYRGFSLIGVHFQVLASDINFGNRVLKPFPAPAITNSILAWLRCNPIITIQNNYSSIAQSPITRE